MRNILSIFSALIFVLCPMKSFGHSLWANGDPIPSYVKESCCGVSDSHHLTQDQIHVVPGGFRVDGYKEIIPQNKTTPSPDGEIWGFWKNYPDGSQSPVYCFFVPVYGT